VNAEKHVYQIGNPCGVCASGIISSRGGHLVCPNCGWYPPGSWTSNTTSAAAEVAGAKEAGRSTGSYTADNDHSNSVAADGRSRAQGPFTSNLENLVRLLKADGGMAWPADDKCSCSACRLKRQIDVELDRLAAETSAPVTYPRCRCGRFEWGPNTTRITDVNGQEHYREACAGFTEKTSCDVGVPMDKREHQPSDICEHGIPRRFCTAVHNDDENARRMP